MEREVKMSRKCKISYLRSRIMVDIEYVNTILDVIVSDRLENKKEVMLLAEIALGKGKNIDRNNQKIGKILKI